MKRLHPSPRRLLSSAMFLGTLVSMALLSEFAKADERQEVSLR